MLKEGCAMAPGEGQEELEEVQSDLRKKDEEVKRSALLSMFVSVFVAVRETIHVT
jgi:hypothetical protein